MLERTERILLYTLLALLTFATFRLGTALEEMGQRLEGGLHSAVSQGISRLRYLQPPASQSGDAGEEIHWVSPDLYPQPDDDVRYTEMFWVVDPDGHSMSLHGVRSIVVNGEIVPIHKKFGTVHWR